MHQLRESKISVSRCRPTTEPDPLFCPNAERPDCTGAARPMIAEEMTVKKLIALLLLTLAACAAEPKLAPAQLDAGLATRVRQELQASTDVNGWNIKVETFNSNVTLTGAVGSVKEKQAAERIAGAVSGVKVVFNQIVIKE